MPFLFRRHRTTYPVVLPQKPSSSTCAGPEAKITDPWNYGFKRHVPFLQTPPFGAGILAITLFIFIILFSDLLLAQINLATLGITVTLGTFGILALILFILFIFS